MAAAATLRCFASGDALGLAHNGMLSPAIGLKPSVARAFGEMRRKLGGDVDLSAFGRVDPDPARMKVKLAADPAGQEGLGPAIFASPTIGWPIAAICARSW